MRRLLNPVALAAALALLAPGCYRGAARFWSAMAIVTTAIVISHPPPPARVVYAPPPRPGYTWQPGYWSLENDDWVWVEGHWVADYPGYRWDPSHWEQDPGGNWRLVPGRWLSAEPPGSSAPPVPPPPAPPQ
jgi:hypothetical protein